MLFIKYIYIFRTNIYLELFKQMFIKIFFFNIYM